MDLALSEEEQAVDALFRDYFEKECPPARVRAAEALGFDPALWSSFAATGACEMGLPEALGGSGARLLEAGIVAERLGRALAPIPFVEHFVASRLLAAFAPIPGDLPTAHAIATLALRPARAGLAALVPAGAVARHCIALDGDALVHVSGPAPDRAIANLAGLPLADRIVGAPSDGRASASERASERRVLASNRDARRHYARALCEWRSLTACALVGLVERAFELGLAYAKEREQFGRPIGSFQVLQHGLADAVVKLDGARLLARKAAWSLDADEASAPRLAGMAFVYCAEVASEISARMLHYHGGVGASLEYDIQLYLRRAKGWALVLDDPAREIARVADLLFGPRGAEAA